MTIFIQHDTDLKIDTSNLTIHEQHLIERLWLPLESHKDQFDSASTGVFPSPDFGYFMLAERYWRASLCIYFAGFGKAFIEAGAGFLEPWLFNCRHAFELYTKGLFLYAAWYEDLTKDPLRRGYKAEIEKIELEHAPAKIYDDYKRNLKAVLEKWDPDEIGEVPEPDKILLSQHAEIILSELTEADPKSFRFRYPSLIHRNPGKKDKIHKMQEMSWVWDAEQLFPETGLPKKAGVMFEHIRVLNSLHDLFRELSDIADYHDANYSYIDELQDYAYEW